MKRLVAILLVLTVLSTGVVAGQEAGNGPIGAELKIYQPHYIDSGVTTDSSGDLPIYETSGRQLEIAPINFRPRDVERVEISEGVGSIRFDATRKVWVLDSGGTEGTFTVLFTVRETAKVNRSNSTETQTVVRTYGAKIQTEKTALSHIPTGDVERLQSDAENWSEVASLYRSVGREGAPIEQKLKFGANLVDAATAPTRALSGDISAAVTTLFMTAGGLIVFILTQIPHLVRSRRIRRENKELKERIGDYEAIDEAADELVSERRKRYLRERSLNDWFSDHDAAWLRRNLAPDPWAAFRRILTMLSPVHIKGVVVGAMLDSDRYVIVAENDVRADGGGGFDFSGSYYMADADQVDDDVETIDSTDELHDLDDRNEIVEQIDGETLDSEVLLTGDVEIRSVALPISNVPADDDLVAKLNVSIPEDFETRERFAEILSRLIIKVAATEYSDEEGYIRPERDLANLLLGFATVGGEAYGSPYLRLIRDLFVHNIDSLDASERAKQVVKESRDSGEKDGGPS